MRVWTYSVGSRRQTTITAARTHTYRLSWHRNVLSPIVVFVVKFGFLDGVRHDDDDDFVF